ncbi:hypothetical protein P7K49_022616 [Saguinus oedipus]|uniref:Uncharacterized protein n=1 Tax=Saguinus oedipus TaxID=9490 RepID=A0ABQ9UJC7_SAGOE|nr:hypothetical protein P7K49_022616 [Saguinus oedipus]
MDPEMHPCLRGYQQLALFCRVPCQKVPRCSSPTTSQCDLELGQRFPAGQADPEANSQPRPAPSPPLTLQQQQQQQNRRHKPGPESPDQGSTCCSWGPTAEDGKSASCVHLTSIPRGCRLQPGKKTGGLLPNKAPCSVSSAFQYRRAFRNTEKRPKQTGSQRRASDECD